MVVLFLLSNSCPVIRLSPAGHRPIGVVRCVVAGQRAGVAAAVVCNRRTVVLANHVDIKVDQPFSRHIRSYRTHAVGRVASGAGETVLTDMQTVLGKAGIRQHLAQVVTLGAHAIGASEANIGIREKVGDSAAGGNCLTELIIVLENVRVDRTMRTIGSAAAELAIVVAVVAIGAESPDAHKPSSCAVLIQHVGQQARLRQWTRTIVRNWMA